MKNINIEMTGNGTFVVKADTERFGKQEIMFEGLTREECMAWLEEMMNFIQEHAEQEDTVKEIKRAVMKNTVIAAYVKAFHIGTKRAWATYRKTLDALTRKFGAASPAVLEDWAFE